MKLGYNTNGLTGHRWPDALALIAETGYEAVALTLDHHCLDPYSSDLPVEVVRMRAALERWGLAVVVETGARFLLNPRVKHAPTLLSPTAEERAVRVDFLCRSIDLARELNAEAVSFWSGALPAGTSQEVGFERLTDGLRRVIGHAEAKAMPLAFEPEPGMFIDTCDSFGRLLERIDSPLFGMTIDVGHVHCIESQTIPDALRTWAGRLCNVHLEDMVRGVHDHLRFGEGEMDFPPIAAALQEIKYTGCVNVELSRHSHMAPTVLRESYEFLRPLFPRD